MSAESRRRGLKNQHGRVKLYQACFAPFLLSSKASHLDPPVPTMSQATTALDPTPLEHALDKNEAIQESVEQSAAELCVVAAVLMHEVPEHLQTGEVALAIQRTEELECRIQTSADDLVKVNQALKEEIDARAELERQLASTQAELDQIQAQATGFSPAQQDPASQGTAAR